MPTYSQWKKDNWDRAHRETDVSALTGTGLGGHLCTLHAGDLIFPEASVLCIGVGTGVWIIEISEEVQDVWALDVSPVAAVRMPKQSHFVTEPRELPGDHFDLALSLWVAPHMSNRDLRVQLCEVVRSLKDTGVFALHYKEPLDENVPLDNLEGHLDEFRKAHCAEMLRRRKHFADMVEWAGGFISEIVQESPSKYHGQIEVSCHIKKQR